MQQQHILNKYNQRQPYMWLIGIKTWVPQSELLRKSTQFSHSNFSSHQQLVS